VKLAANLGRNLMDGRLGILTAVFGAASAQTRIHMENRS
jgi:sarcosine/dimethylglycine N-methyltransferase